MVASRLEQAELVVQIFGLQSYSNDFRSEHLGLSVLHGGRSYCKIRIGSKIRITLRFPLASDAHSAFDVLRFAWTTLLVHRCRWFLMGSYREPAGSLEVEDMDWGMTSVDAAFNRLVAGVRPGRTSWGVTVRANQAIK